MIVKWYGVVMKQKNVADNQYSKRSVDIGYYMETFDEICIFTNIHL